jgi:hypothetical protein
MSTKKMLVIMIAVVCPVPFVWYHFRGKPSAPVLKLTQTTRVVHRVTCGAIEERSSPPSVPVIVLGAGGAFSYGINEGRIPVVKHKPCEVVTDVTKVFWLTATGVSEYSGARLFMTSGEALTKLERYISVQGDAPPESVFKSPQEIYSVLIGQPKPEGTAP